MVSHRTSLRRKCHDAARALLCRLCYLRKDAVRVSSLGADGVMILLAVAFVSELHNKMDRAQKHEFQSDLIEDLEGIAQLTKDQNRVLCDKANTCEMDDGACVDIKRVLGLSRSLSCGLSYLFFLFSFFLWRMLVAMSCSNCPDHGRTGCAGHGGRYVWRVHGGGVESHRFFSFFRRPCGLVAWSPTELFDPNFSTVEKFRRIPPRQEALSPRTSTVTPKIRTMEHAKSSVDAIGIPGGRALVGLCVEFNFGDEKGTNFTFFRSIAKKAKRILDAGAAHEGLVRGDRVRVSRGLTRRSRYRRISQSLPRPENTPN